MPVQLVIADHMLVLGAEKPAVLQLAHILIGQMDVLDLGHRLSVGEENGVKGGALLGRRAVMLEHIFESCDGKISF